jgi:hypothetical protein
MTYSPQNLLSPQWKRIEVRGDIGRGMWGFIKGMIIDSIFCRH